MSSCHGLCSKTRCAISRLCSCSCCEPLSMDGSPAVKMRSQAAGHFDLVWHGAASLLLTVLLADIKVAHQLRGKLQQPLQWFAMPLNLFWKIW